MLELTDKAAIVEGKLNNLYTTKPEESMFWSVAFRDKAIGSYIDKISEAEEELRLIIDLRIAARLRQKDIILNLIDRVRSLSSDGVSIEIILSGVAPGSLEETFMKSIAKYFDELDKVAVKHCEQCPTAFDIIDNKKIVLKVMNPVKPEEFFAWIFVWQKKFALELKTKFQELWSNASELGIEIA